MGVVDEMVCFSLYAATRATTQAYRSLLEPWSLTYPQYLVLILLWDSDNRAVRDLGESRLSLLAIQLDEQRQLAAIERLIGGSL